MQRHDNELLTRNEAAERYPGQYILMRVTDHVDGWLAKGYILATAQRRADLVDEEIRLLSTARQDGYRYCTFRGQKVYRTILDLWAEQGRNPNGGTPGDERER